MSETSKTMDLLHRVGSDVSKLREEIVSMIQNTDHQAIAENARTLALRGKQQLREGRALAAQYLKEHPTQSSAGLLGGLVVLGLVGAGIYYLCKKDRPSCEENLEDDEYPYGDSKPQLPSYIS